MGALKDLSGLPFGKLIVLERYGMKNDKIGWLCLCDCGNQAVCAARDFKFVNVTCGCHLLKNKETKVCAMCNIEKPKDQFHKNKKACATQSKCKECMASYKKERYWSNHKVELAKSTKSRLKPENVKQRKNYYQINKEKYHQQFLKDTANGKRKLTYHKYRKKYAEELKAKARIKSKTKEYMDMVNKIHHRRKLVDVEYVLKRRLRCRLRHVIRAISNGAKKHKSTMELLGCDISFFKKYIEDKFTDGMCWERISDWHIDHVRPCVNFDLTKKEEQEKCFHYTNLQPLWAKDNLAKGAKY